MNKITSTQKQILSLLADPHTSHKIKRNLVNALDSQSIDKICEFILNVVNKNAPICAESRKNLLPQAKFCRRLLHKKISIKEKKRILIKKGIQKGGFLQFIIPAIISAIGGIISSVITSTAKETQE
jgi:hypothetical protein